MTTVSIQKQKQKMKKETGCRKIHFSIHTPNLKLEFCANCDGYVQLLNGNICSCCNKVVPKMIKYTWLTRVLKFGVKQHHNFLKDWLLYPDYCTVKPLDKPYVWNQVVYNEDGEPEIDEKTGETKTRKIMVKEGFSAPPRNSQFLEVRYRETVYQIPVKYLALALVANDGDVIDEKTRKVVIQGGEEAKLKLIKKHTGIKGFRVFYPEEEQMDLKCKRCCELLKYDKDDNIFCPSCDRNNNHLQ